MSRIGLFGQISEINDHLYLSGAGVLRPDVVKKKQIVCIVNATTEEPNAHLPGVDCVKIRIEDHPYARLDHYFDQVADKIRSVRDKGGRTLVHCVAGVSRSAALCICYLIKYERMSLRQAYHYVKSARPIIRPNIGFWKQMVEYERKLRGHSTVTMIPVEGCPLPFPDVYSQDLRRHILVNPALAAHSDPLVAAAAQQQQRNGASNGAIASCSPHKGSKCTVIPVDYVGKRRGLSAGTAADAHHRNSHRHSAFPVVTSIPVVPASSSSSSPWRHAASMSLLSHGAPASGRRSAASSSSKRDNNLFSNLYNSSRQAFFPAF